MNTRITGIFFIIPLFILGACSSGKEKNCEGNQKTNILFLHHSTGNRIWLGDQSNLFSKLRYKITHKPAIVSWFNDYNKSNNTCYIIKDQFFPKKKPYGWHNYPYDYYNIWIKHGGNKPYMEEPTLDMLTRNYNVIIWKHCFPVSNILPDSIAPDIDSDIKTLGNYKLQYEALKSKMHDFPETKFIVWTGAALVRQATTEENARRARDFFNWVRHQWDEPGDNIYLWDFYQLETEGDLYMKPEYASGNTDSHPNPTFSQKVYPLFCQRVVDIIETGGEKTTLTGELK